MRIVVLGAGESGVGSAILAQKKGFDVFVSDMSAIKPKYKEELERRGIPYEEKQHTERRLTLEIQRIDLSKTTKKNGSPC